MQPLLQLCYHAVTGSISRRKICTSQILLTFLEILIAALIRFEIWLKQYLEQLKINAVPICSNDKKGILNLVFSTLTFL